MASLFKHIYTGIYLWFWLLASSPTKGIATINYLANVMCKLRDTGELLVLPEGETHNILCTAPAEGHIITWGSSKGQIGKGGTFTVGQEEEVGEEMKGIRITFTATTPLVNNTILTCAVLNIHQPSSSPEPRIFNITIQGLPKFMDNRNMMSCLKNNYRHSTSS